MTGTRRTPDDVDLLPLWSRETDVVSSSRPPMSVARSVRSRALDPPWAVSCDWQMARSIYEVDLPEDGWWVRVDHSDTLNALVDQYPGYEEHRNGKSR